MSAGKAKPNNGRNPAGKDISAKVDRVANEGSGKLGKKC